MASLGRRDYISTLPFPRPDPILSMHKKFTYYFLDRLRWKWDIRNTNTQLVVEARTQFLRLVGLISYQLDHPNVSHF